jgi:Queuosine biosynthesis protein QueC
MAEVRVAGGRGSKKLFFSFDAAKGDFPLDFERLQAKALAPVDAACWDFLEIAATVFAADTSTRRGSPSRPHLGAGWRRSFAFSVPVVRHDIWSSPHMQAALADAVSFLTDDEVVFEFSAKPEVPPRQYPLLDDTTATPFPASEIILFSGGLDSLSGAMHRLTTSEDRVVLVTREGRTKETPRPRVLGSHVARLFDGRVLHARFKATRSWGRGPERTQRSRSFLLAALGYVHARIFGAPKVCFYENGVISHNLPISPQVIGTMSTRTTHPLALRKIVRIFDLLAESLGHSRIALENPYQWLTKSEVIGRLQAAGGERLIAQSVSCTSLQAQSNTHTHCGSCSQCLDRRFAIVALGLEEYDPVHRYLTDVFLGPRPKDQSRTMALDWTRRSLEAAEIEVVEFVAQNSQEIVRIASGHRELSSAAAIARMHDLNRRHGAAAKHALSRVVASQSDAIIAGGLPETSLLRMLLANRLSVPEQPWRRLVQSFPEQRVSSQMPAQSNRFPLQVAFGEDGGGNFVDVLELATLTGVQADFAHRLKVPFDEDRSAQLRLEEYRYTHAGTAHTVSKDAAKRCAARIRQTLREAYFAVEETLPERELLIETKQGKGYRLDPTINVIRSADDR